MRTIGSSGPAPPLPPTTWSRLLSLVRRWRRLIAAALLAGASGIAVQAVAASRAQPPQVMVVVSSRDLPSGAILTAGDTSMVPLPRGSRPAGSLTTRAAATGHALAGAVRSGEVLTDARLAGGGLLTAQAPGELAVPVTIDAPLPAGLFSPGDLVAVLGGSSEAAAGDDSGGGVGGDSGGGVVLVAKARVLALPAPSSGATLLSGTGSGKGAVAVLALDSAQAARLAGASGERTITLALVRSSARVGP